MNAIDTAREFVLKKFREHHTVDFPVEASDEYSWAMLLIEWSEYISKVDKPKLTPVFETKCFQLSDQHNNLYSCWFKQNGAKVWSAAISYNSLMPEMFGSITNEPSVRDAIDLVSRYHVFYNFK